MAVFLLVLRFFAQLYCEPKIVDAIRKNDETRLLRLFSWIGFTLPAETAMGIAILAVTSLLIITTPPLAPHYSFARSAVSQGIALSLTEQPSESGKFLVTAEDPLTRDRRGREKDGRHTHEPGGGCRPDRRAGREEICRRICIR